MLKGFEKYLVDGGKSINTVKNYINHVDCFTKWHIGSFGTKPQRLNRVAVLDYISYLRSVKNASPRTINTKIYALVGFNLYLIDKGLQDNLVISGRDKMDPDKGRPGAGIITKEMVDKFIEDILKYESRRDYTLATILAYAGLRISEALDLRKQDVVAKERVLIVGGSGKRDRKRVPVDKRVIEVLSQYIKEAKDLKDDSQYIFGSRQGERMSRTRVNQIFKKHSDIITPEKLRRYYHAHALGEGCNTSEAHKRA